MVWQKDRQIISNRQMSTMCIIYSDENIQQKYITTLTTYNKQ